MSDELVIAVIPGTKLAQPYPKALAEAQGFEVLDDEPLYKFGRIRPAFRVDGRQIKPKRRLKKADAEAIPTSRKSDGGETADTSKE